MPSPTTARRNALFALFFLPGVTMASWITRTPDVRDLVGASTAQMGFILFGLSVGSMLGILGSGALVARWGTRPVIAAGIVAVAAGAAVVGVGAAVGSGLVVAVGLGLFGCGMGSGEIALNVEGAEVERALGRSTLPALHGFFSLGTVVGATVGMVLTAVAFPVAAHLALVAVVVLGVLVVAVRHLPVGVGKRDRGAATAEPAAAPVGAPRTPLWRDTRLVLLGCFILALALAEGAANDWLPLVMVDGHGLDAALGSAVYAVFAAAMTAGRMVGGRLVDRFGRATVLAGSALVGAVGIGLVSLVDHQGVAVGAAVLWGLGASLAFPVALSAAGDSGPDGPDGEDGAARVSLAATLGYVAFLVGPPVLGVLGEHVGLRHALLVVMALVVLAVLATPAARPRRDDPADTADAADTADPADPADTGDATPDDAARRPVEVSGPRDGV